MGKAVSSDEGGSGLIRFTGFGEKRGWVWEAGVDWAPRQGDIGHRGKGPFGRIPAP